MWQDVAATRVTVSLNQNQWDSLVSFSYNLGVGTFREHLLPLINGGKLKQVPAIMMQFDRMRGTPLPGSERIREAEDELFGSD